MEYLKLILGIILIAVYLWILIRKVRSSTFPRTLLHLDLVIGLVAGCYIVITCAISIVA